MEIFAPLVGVTFRGAACKEIVKKLTPEDGNLLRLEADPTNEYDSNAVKVMYEPTGDHIGFIAKENNQQIFAALEAGETLQVQIVGFENSIKPTLLITDNEALNNLPEIAEPYKPSLGDHPTAEDMGIYPGDR